VTEPALRQSDSNGQAGNCAGRVLDVARAAELPIQQPMKIEVFIKQKAAKALGIDVPPNLLTIADEVIE